MSVTLRHILVPIDFGSASTRALELGRMLADACGASLHLLHVVGYPLGRAKGGVDERDEALERLDALLNETDRDKRRVTTCCRVGTPAPEIAGYAADNAIDLIVMGTHSHGPTFQMTTGSIAESVLGLAPCAVLAAKDPSPASSARSPESRCVPAPGRQPAMQPRGAGLAAGSIMSAERSDMHGGDTPLAQLERTLIDEFVRERGYDPLKLGDLPDEERTTLLTAASVYASGKLMEVETRSHFLQEIHDGAQGIRRTGLG